MIEAKVADIGLKFETPPVCFRRRGWTPVL
jgi:hypothetical protein